MRRALRENWLWALAAAGAGALVAWLTLGSFAWNDYEQEALPAVRALVAGRLHEFLQLSPVYGGSLVERAPFALLPGLWGGGELAVYRMLALPALLAVTALGTWLTIRMRSRGLPAAMSAVALTVCVLNPIVLLALEIGHPEELLGACMCIAAVLLAAASEVSRRRAAAAGLLLGLAVANKDWAALAAGPVLLALPAPRRALGAATAFLTATVVFAPLLLTSSSSFVSGTAAVGGGPSPIFQPWQVWWFLGSHGTLVRGSTGAPKPGYRHGPAWIEAHSHLLILLVGLAITAALWLVWRRRADRERRLPEREALAALALLLLARCMLDTWDFVYYALPFLLAMLASETTARDAPRAPLAAMAATLAVWANFEWLPAHASPDVQAGFFLAWSLPLAAWLAMATFRPPLRLASGDVDADADGSPSGTPLAERLRLGLPAQDTTVRSFGRPVSTSPPPSRTTTRSSIRTPSTSGR